MSFLKRKDALFSIVNYDNLFSFTTHSSLFVCLLAKQCMCQLIVQKILVVGTLGIQNVNFFLWFWR